MAVGAHLDLVRVELPIARRVAGEGEFVCLPVYLESARVFRALDQAMGRPIFRVYVVADVLEHVVASGVEADRHLDLLAEPRSVCVFIRDEPPRGRDPQGAGDQDVTYLPADLRFARRLGRLVIRNDIDGAHGLCLRHALVKHTICVRSESMEPKGRTSGVIHLGP